jgi:hypothetical protein
MAQNVTTKARVGLIGIAALALMANDANAQRRTTVQASVRRPPHTVRQAKSHILRPPPALPSSMDVYQSYSQGHQSYPNPDRDFYRDKGVDY